MRITRKDLEGLLKNLNMKRAEAGKTDLLTLDRYQPGDSRRTYRLAMIGDSGALYTIWGLKSRMTAGEVALVLRSMLAAYNDDDMIRR
jgi:hypothetical protein